MVQLTADAFETAVFNFHKIKSVRTRYATPVKKILFWPDCNYNVWLGVLHTIFSTKEFTSLFFPKISSLKFYTIRFWTSVEYCCSSYISTLECKYEYEPDSVVPEGIRMVGKQVPDTCQHAFWLKHGSGGDFFYFIWIRYTVFGYSPVFMQD